MPRTPADWERYRQQHMCSYLEDDSVLASIIAHDLLLVQEVRMGYLDSPPEITYYEFNSKHEQEALGAYLDGLGEESFDGQVTVHTVTKAIYGHNHAYLHARIRKMLTLSSKFNRTGGRVYTLDHRSSHDAVVVRAREDVLVQLRRTVGGLENT